MASVEDRLYPFLKFYMESPQWFKSVVGGAYAWLPETVKHGRRYRDYYEEALITDPDVHSRTVSPGRPSPTIVTFAVIFNGSAN